ncbi:MAG: hypothetical protein OXI81_12340 [Paracoccaceae bacterium]|nr:hypothetical protein [Paracoccaceae bacterium]
MIDELRVRTPDLRRQEQALNHDLQSVVDHAKDRGAGDRDTWLRLAETLTGSIDRLRASAIAEMLDVADRQRIVLSW